MMRIKVTLLLVFILLVSLHITLHNVFLGGWEVKEILPRDDMEQNDKMSFLYLSISLIAPIVGAKKLRVFKLFFY